MKKRISGAAAVAREREKRNRINARLSVVAREGVRALLPEYMERGLGPEQVAAMRAEFGENRISRRDGESLLCRFGRAFLNPFSLILLGLAAVSFASDVWFAEPGERDAMTVCIVLVMVVVGGVVRLVQETRSGNAAARLSEMIRTTATVLRSGEGEVELPLEERERQSNAERKEMEYLDNFNKELDRMIAEEKARIKEEAKKKLEKS